MKVELVYVGTGRQELLELEVDDGCTAGDLIAISSMVDRFPDEPIANADIGVWGQSVARDYRLRDGDRVEIYRPLILDPREARMQRVKD